MFVNDINNNDHYDFTAKHVLRGFDTNSLEIMYNRNSLNCLNVEPDTSIQLTCDDELFRITGSLRPRCDIFNLDCTALSSDVHEELLHRV